MLSWTDPRRVSKVSTTELSVRSDLNRKEFFLIKTRSTRMHRLMFQLIGPRLWGRPDESLCLCRLHHANWLGQSSLRKGLLTRRGERELAIKMNVNNKSNKQMRSAFERQACASSRQALQKLQHRHQLATKRQRILSRFATRHASQEPNAEGI